MFALTCKLLGAAALLVSLIPATAAPLIRESFSGLISLDSEGIRETFFIPRFSFSQRSLRGVELFIDIEHNLTLLVENPTSTEQMYSIHGDMSPAITSFPGGCDPPSLNGRPYENPDTAFGSLGPGASEFNMLEIGSGNHFVSKASSFNPSACRDGGLIGISGEGNFMVEKGMVDAWLVSANSQVEWTWHYIYDSDPIMVVPEASSLWMFGAGIALLSLLMLRKCHKRRP